MYFNAYEYSGAAHQFCYSQNLDPNEEVPQVGKPSAPRWIVVASEMHTVRMMVTFMRQSGIAL